MIYLRLTVASILVLAAVIAAALLHRRRPAPHQTLLVSLDDGGLGRRIDRLSFDHVPRSRALDELRARAGINLQTSWAAQFGPPSDPLVTLTLKDVTVGTALRLISDQHDLDVIDGKVIVTGDSAMPIPTFRVYDVRDLVSPPTAAGVALPPSLRGRNDWLGVDGIHGGPSELALPPVVDELALIDVLNQMLFSTSFQTHEGFAPQVVSGRLLGLFTLEEDIQITDALEQLRHPLSVAIDDHPKTMLERRIPHLQLHNVTLEEAVDRLREATGANVIVRLPDAAAHGWHQKVAVSEDRDDVDLETALCDLIAQVVGENRGLTVYEVGGVVIAGLGDNTADDRVLRTYDVSELLRRYGAAIIAADDTAPTPSGRQEEHSLIELMIQNVSVQWAGGVARVWHGKLLVLQPPRVQAQVWGFLHRVLQNGPQPAR